MKLTKSAIDAMRFEGTHPKAKDVRWDDDLAGFGVRVWASGKKTFVFKYRYEGRQRYLTLGDYGALTPAQARDMATMRRADVLRGIDPLAEKQKVLRGETIAHLCRAYIERHARPHNKTWAKDQERIDRYVLPAFGTLKVASVKRRDVAALHHKIGLTRKTTANRVLSLLSSMFNLARDWGFLEEGSPNPATRIERFAEEKRDRFVTQAEMPRLAGAIDAEDNLYIRAALWLYLVTGLRKNELLSLRWDAVDLKGGQVRLGDTKAGRPHYLPLSSAALQMFDLVPRQRGNPFVFCGAKKGRHLVNISKSWIRVRTAAKLDDVRLHDLRRTVGSWMAQSGESLPLIGRVLNHSNVSTTQVYARFHQDPVAKALEEHGRQIREAVGLHVASLPATDAADVD